uniref:protein misato homolog 1 isoform X2 n=1 Tax=Myxine glutinosa TaxID=7769 RepID=UPI00358E7D10
MAGEVVTVQLGNYANFVGSHWWNLQEEYLCNGSQALKHAEINNNVLFREGLAMHGRPKYTPRVVLLDLKGSLGSLKQEEDAYQRTQSTQHCITWDGPLTAHCTEAAEKNEYLRDLKKHDENSMRREVLRPRAANDTRSRSSMGSKVYWLEDSVKVWSDFQRVPLHPRSISILKQYSHEGESDRLATFGLGFQLLSHPDVAEDFEDRLHFFVEECDHLQGFQLLCDWEDGFSGFACRAVEILHDYYDAKGVLTWGLLPGPSQTKVQVPGRNVNHVLNSALAIAHLAESSSLLCPLSVCPSFKCRPSTPLNFPHIQYQADMKYHSSAILASALETSTLPYRLNSSPASLCQYAESLNYCGRKVAVTRLSFPFSLARGWCLPDALTRHALETSWQCLCPSGYEQSERCFTQAVSLRGVSAHQSRGFVPPGKEPMSRLHACESGESVLSLYLQTQYPNMPNSVLLAETPINVKTPFPNIFSSSIDQNGYLAEETRSAATVQQVSALTAVQSAAGLHSSLQELCAEATRFAGSMATGMEQEDLSNALHNLHSLADNYKFGFGESDVDESDSD